VDNSALLVAPEDVGRCTDWVSAVP